MTSRNYGPPEPPDSPRDKGPLDAPKVNISGPHPTDKSGHLRSMFANWTGEAVIVVSGFILPRLINQGMSQEALGIWDYGWSMRSYVALACGSLGSGAGHYVARYRSSEQWPELGRTLGAMLALVIYGSACAALLVLGLTYFTPWLVNTRSVAHIGDARSLVLSMGAASCLATVTLVFGGIIVGSGRFDVLNLIDGLCDVLVVAGVLTCVVFGLGLKVMGLCVLMRELLNGVAKYACAKHIFPQVHVRPRWTDRSTFREIFGFSAKTMVDVVSKVLYQVGPLVISTVIGPAALALYSRPRALILITTRFVMGFARVLVPAASAFHGQQDHKGLAELLVRSSRYAMFLSLPPTLVRSCVPDRVSRECRFEHFVRRGARLGNRRGGAGGGNSRLRGQPLCPPVCWMQSSGDTAAPLPEGISALASTLRHTICRRAPGNSRMAS